MSNLENWLGKDRWSQCEAALIWAGIDPDSCRWQEEVSGPSVDLQFGARLFSGEHLVANRFTERPPVDPKPEYTEEAELFYSKILFGMRLDDICKEKIVGFKWSSEKAGRSYLDRLKTWETDFDSVVEAQRTAQRIYEILGKVISFPDAVVGDYFEAMFRGKYPPPWLNSAEKAGLLKKFPVELYKSFLKKETPEERYRRIKKLWVEKTEDGDPLSQEAIGEIEGVTGSRIGQIIREGDRKVLQGRYVERPGT